MSDFLDFGENANFNTAGIKVWIAEANQEFTRLRKQNADFADRLDALDRFVKRYTKQAAKVEVAREEAFADLNDQHDFLADRLDALDQELAALTRQARPAWERDKEGFSDGKPTPQ